MEQIKHSTEILQIIQTIKQNNQPLITNFFIEPNKLDRWINKNLITYIKTDYGVLLFRKNNTFYYLYYLTNSMNNLNALLKKYLIKSKFVVDVIGIRENVLEIIDSFVTIGFELHAQLNRYVRINNGNVQINKSTADIALASDDDASQITNLLEENLDPFSEQIPTLEEVVDLIKDKRIIEIKHNCVVEGFLIRTFTGHTSLLNNLFVDKAFRNKGIGNNLLAYYIDEAKSVKRMILWVLSSNTIASDLYLKYGYTKDTLIDFVLTN